MGVTHGKKRDLQDFPASMMKTPQPEQEDQFPEIQGIFPSQLHSEEEGSHLIRPHKPLNPLTASKSHQELHKELQMTHKRRVTQEGKTELQRALEKRKWEQRMKAGRDQQEANKNTSPLHQELLKRQQRLENLEREEKSKQEEPEFLQVKERLRRTTVTDAGEKQV
ncbi:actin-associated protein FAM107A [Acanthochromis polyacanthus]|uniref:Actin-associated protein FAM107A n=1 Tax=Acanthochromis polyacanthus TaxID=80966 RepID=A0A3Q1HSC9_9TELE|nr:actin-associated protein FAM107A [Acanthochromis polyacanthus]